MPGSSTAGVTPQDVKPPLAARFARSRELTAKAGKTGSHPEYLTPQAVIPAYDPATFRRDPEAYLEQAVPARAFQMASPDSGAPLLRLDGPVLRPAQAGQAQTFTLHAAPGAPVSVFCGDLVQFDNGLPALSLQADAQGVVTFTATPLPGCTDDAHIAVASPEAVGLINLTLNVAAP